MFELYCVAGFSASRNALAQGANKVIQWIQREEERIFIIGGAVSNSQCHGRRHGNTDVSLGLLIRRRVIKDADARRSVETV